MADSKDQEQVAHDEQDQPQPATGEASAGDGADVTADTGDAPVAAGADGSAADRGDLPGVDTGEPAHAGPGFPGGTQGREPAGASSADALADEAGAVSGAADPVPPAGDETAMPAAHNAGADAAAADPMAAIVAALDADDTAEAFTRPAAELKAIVEALIFASPDPLTPKALLKLLDNEPKEDVLAALETLKQDYERPGGLQLVEVAGGFQIVTRSDLHEWVRRLFHERSTQKLSAAALETLAVIAYRQPITAIEITEIRGVNTSGVLNTLLERHLVKIVGRKQVVGRPFMYATTKEFLIRFGLKDLSDLPRVEDMAESLGIESSLLVEQTPPEEQLPLSEPDDGGSDDADQDAEAVERDDDDSGEPGPSVH